MLLPRLYVNGFPKAGLHLAELMVSTLFKPANPGHNWYGTNAWTAETLRLDKAVVMAIVKPGHYLKGHSGWSAELNKMMVGLQVGMVFVYRDLRDVVVSQAYHILSKNPNLIHPARELYSKDLQSVMCEVIAGVGDKDGIMARWQSFAPWLDLTWVFPVKYADLLHRPEKVASRFFDYILSLRLTYDGIDAMQVDRAYKNKLVQAMVNNMHNTHTVTYRKAKTRQWRYEFTPEHVQLFKQYDPQNVLMQLGFEKRQDWH
jgi:hypothetical protein